MILSQQLNPGIKYEYLLPINFAASEEGTSDTDYSMEENLPLNTKLKAANRQYPDGNNTGKRKRKFTWKVIGFTECSKSCGGGIQHPIIRCAKGEDSNVRIYSRKKCAHLKHPTINESSVKCNIQPCPAFWKISEWSSCKCENSESSFKTREVKCVQELISGVVIQVNAGACSEERPIGTTACDCNRYQMKPVKVDSSKTYQNISIIQHQNTQNDQKIFVNRGNKLKPTKSKKAGVWLTSDWYVLN